MTTHPRLDLDALDLDALATALQDTGGYLEWLIDTRTGEVVPREEQFGRAGEEDGAEEDTDDDALVLVDPYPSYVWYEDLTDFALRIADERAGQALARAIEGKGAFRRFKDILHQRFPELVPLWYAFRDTRAEQRAVRWLLDMELVDDAAAERWFEAHPDPDLTRPVS